MLKTYTKPVVTRVNLIPAEAVLSGCKTYMIESYPGPGDATACCYGGPQCVEQGS